MLPVPGLNLSTPTYAIVGLACLIRRTIHGNRAATSTSGSSRDDACKDKPFSITAIVPAYNEEDGIGGTLESLTHQTVPFDEIIVADDASTDRTRDVALEYGVTVVTPAHNLGSKARAQNHALPYAKTDLVLPVDADTLLAPNYVEMIEKPFLDPDVAIAAGCVLTRRSHTLTERGRTIEYLFGFHWHRPIQNAANSPMVCSGCDSAFRRKDLVDFGGFPERTIVEDMDYTWSQQIAGKRAVYVGGAVAYAADPSTMEYLRKQVWRWMAGFFQNVRIHAREVAVRKRMLALWVFLAVWEILTVPLWYAMPFIWILMFHWKLTTAALWFFGAEFALVVPPLLYGSLRRGVSVIHVFACLPALYVVKAVNFSYAWKALFVELLLVPMGRSNGLHDYEKGRADTAPTEPVPSSREAPGHHRAA